MSVWSALLFWIVFSFYGSEHQTSGKFIASRDWAISTSLSMADDESIIYISFANGMDNSECGLEGDSPCRTLVYACGRGESPRMLRVGVGNYMETYGVIVENTLDIIGESQTRCVLTKATNSDFVLFTLTVAGAQLTIGNISILLTNHTATANFVRSSGANNTVFVTFHTCCITMAVGSGEIYGQSILINNTLASLLFDRCMIYNITNPITNVFPFIYCYQVHTLQINGSSFMNVRNNGQLTARGGCFYFRRGSSLILKQSLFVACHSEYYGGMGYADVLTMAVHLVQSCNFWNTTADYYTGGLHIGSTANSQSSAPSFNITNSTWTFCSSFTMGGALGLLRSVNLTLTLCTFTECRTASVISYGGGAAYMRGGCYGVIERCTFANCSSNSGGALQINGSSNVTITDSVFLRNAGTGRDVYVGFRWLRFQDRSQTRNQQKVPSFVTIARVV